LPPAEKHPHWRAALHDHATTLPRLPRSVAVVRCRLANVFRRSCHTASPPPPLRTKSAIEARGFSTIEAIAVMRATLHHRAPNTY
jgi:hypothetical protein